MAVTKGNIRVEPMNLTWNTTDLGATEGGIDISFKFDTQDVKCDQYGSNVIDAFLTGKQIEDIKVTLLETDETKLSALFDGGVGGKMTPASGTEAYGLGTGKDFELMSSVAQKLIMHPTRLGGSDKSKDVTVWKAVPVPGSLSFSGEKMSTATFTFKVYPDLTLDPAIQYFVVGDGSQDFS